MKKYANFEQTVRLNPYKVINIVIIIIILLLLLLLLLLLALTF